MMKMTAKEVASLRASTRPRQVSVDTGLHLRIAIDGTKMWIVRYSVDGRQREYRLSKEYGIVTDDGHLSLADARIEAAAIRALARSGVDVQVRQEETKLADAQSKEIVRSENRTFADLFNAWVTDGVRRKDGNAELVRSFNADVIPSIGMHRIRDLNEHNLRAVLRAIVARGVNRTAVMMFNNLTQLFAWAQKRQPWRMLLVDGNPMDLIEIEKIVAPGYDLDNQRKRILSSDEIRELKSIFQRTQDEYNNRSDKRFGPQPIERTTQCAIWIMLSTLSRVGETSMARWEHIDFKRDKWFIPKQNVKDSVADLDIFLSGFALEQFHALHEITGHSDWCFPGRGDSSHISVKAISKQIGDRQTMFKKNGADGPRRKMKNRRQDNTLVLSGGSQGDWVSHDLRRTGATIMQSLRVPLDIIDRCQNHVLPGSKVRRHYLHHDYAEEKQDAWRRLGEHLRSLLSELV